MCRLADPRMCVGRVSGWAISSLRVLGTLEGGSFLRELIHLGEGVVPGTATDWTAVKCGAKCHRSTQKREDWV
jgi:hypothetical protein